MISDQILLGLLVSVLPGLEAIVGIPLIVKYALSHNLSFFPWVLLSSALNILSIGFVFFFWDYLHHHLEKVKSYQRIVGIFLKRVHRHKTKILGQMNRWGYFALVAFVALPFPGNGAWTCATLAWILDLPRAKSWIAITLGLIISHLLVLLASLGLFSLY